MDISQTEKTVPNGRNSRPVTGFDIMIAFSGWQVSTKSLVLEAGCSLLPFRYNDQQFLKLAPMKLQLQFDWGKQKTDEDDARAVIGRVFR